MSVHFTSPTETLEDHFTRASHLIKSQSRSNSLEMQAYKSKINLHITSPPCQVGQGQRRLMKHVTTLSIRHGQLLVLQAQVQNFWQRGLLKRSATYNNDSPQNSRLFRRLDSLLDRPSALYLYLHLLSALPLKPRPDVINSGKYRNHRCDCQIAIID